MPAGMRPGPLLLSGGERIGAGPASVGPMARTLTPWLNGGRMMVPASLSRPVSWLIRHNGEAILRSVGRPDTTVLIPVTYAILRLCTLWPQRHPLAPKRRFSPAWIPAQLSPGSTTQQHRVQGDINADRYPRPHPPDHDGP